jgi:hypothetical protein
LSQRPTKTLLTYAHATKDKENEMITAIFTAEGTELTIETTELVNLEQMGPQGNLIQLAQLSKGTYTRDVGAGVFKVVSKQPVSVTSSSANSFIKNIPNNKDGTFPDQTIVDKFGLDLATTRKFFFDARSIGAPQ